MNFPEELKSRTEEVNRIVESYLPAEVGKAATVLKAMNYSVRVGGKRLRPLFISETNRMYGGRRKLAEPFMAALEMIHTYSLVHDDLPEMDGDLFRRGKPTTHSVFGQGMGVLAGDGLLNYAYETAFRAFESATTPEETQAVCSALRVLAANAGVYGMVGGQCCDLEMEGKQADAATLLYIHRHKTACMIESGFCIGAILAGAPESDVEKLRKTAENIGIAFQIQDDILDVEGTQEELGKSIGKDAAEGKVTYVSLFGLEKAREDNRRLTEEALALFGELSVSNEFLYELIRSLLERNR